MASTARGGSWWVRKMIEAVSGSTADLPSPQVTIRTFSFPQDYPAVLALWEQAGPGVHVGRSDQPEEIKKKLSRDPELFLVAEVNGRIIGSVLGGYDGRRGIVYHLAVELAYRQNGIGTMLMEELEQRLRDCGCLKSYLLVTFDNQASIDFYEKRGWERMPLYIYGKELL
jgi:ribosomal protein S18 acetylase RimI-like enzyme